MQKRVIHKPKAYILKIEPSDDKVGHVSNALDIFLPDGRRLTKEMLEEMELSTDSDETEKKTGEINASEKRHESVEENTKENLQVCIENKDSKKEAQDSYVEPLKEEAMPEPTEPVIHVEHDEPALETFVFAPASKPVLKIVRHTIESMLSCLEREEIPLNIDRTILRKPDSNVQKFRIEMNRIAWKNIDEVVRVVKHIKFTRAEMRKCAEILFEKAVAEETFCILYAAFLSKLRDFFYLGEGKDKEGDSFMFTSIIEMCFEAIEKKQSWGAFTAFLLKEDKVVNEDEKENAIIKANKVKDGIFGALRFLMILAVNNIIEFSFLKELINNIMKNTCDEDGEVLSFFITGTMYELFLVDHQFFSTVESYLKACVNVSKETRIKFMIMDTLDSMQRVSKGQVLPSKFYESRLDSAVATAEEKTEDSRFRRGAKVGSESSTRHSTPIGELTSKVGSMNIKNKINASKRGSNLKQEKTRSEPFTVQNTFDMAKKQEKITDENLEYCNRIIEEISYYKEEEREMSLQEINQDIREKKITKSIFATSFIFVGIKSDYYEECINYFIYATKHLAIESKLVFNGLSYMKEMMEELSIDFPNIKNRFEKFCITFRKRGLIDRGQFEKLEIDETKQEEGCRRAAIDANNENDK